jgi:hypothetical protein
MIDLTDVPDTRPIPAPRRSADEAMLRAKVVANHGQAPTRRRPRFVTVAVVGILGVIAVGGVAAAGAFLAPKPATDRGTGRCYSTISSDFGDHFPGSSMGNAAPPGGAAPALPPLAIADCAASWRAGAMTFPGTHPSPNAAGDYPVPPLVACVLPSGEAAVFPGPPSTCASLGLPTLKE